MRRLIMAYSWLILGLFLDGCSHGPWIVDVSECDPTPSNIKVCHKVMEYK